MDRKINPDIHIICGKCGCATMFNYEVVVEENDDTGAKKPSVYLTCGNCSTLTGLDEIVDNKTNIEKFIDKLVSTDDKIVEHVDVYIVPWIESESGWGQKNDGYKIFSDLESAKVISALDIKKGPNSDGSLYIGPEKPITYFKAKYYGPRREFPFHTQKIYFVDDFKEITQIIT